MEKLDLSMFIDESGSITKTNISSNRYFVIAILFTRKFGRLKRYFQKGIASLIQNPKYKEMLESNGEIKGSKLSETKKKSIYERIIRNCANDFELGIIVLDNHYTTDAKYTLDEYLEQHFTILNPLCNSVSVKYTDSKNHSMIQLIDFISNTFYRNLEKHGQTSIETVKMLLPYVCGGKIFDFSTNHDTKLLLDE